MERMRRNATATERPCLSGMRVTLLAILLSLSTVTVVSAQPSKASDVHKMNKDDCAKARAQNKTCVLTIEDGDNIEGNTPTMGDPGITIAGFGKGTSLIRLRRDFIPEILKTAEDL